MSIKQILGLITWVTFGALTVCCLIVGENELFTPLAFIYLLAGLVVMGLFLAMEKGIALTLLQLFVPLVLLYYYFPIFGLLFMPDNFAGGRIHRVPISQQEIEHASLILLLSIACACAAIMLGGRFKVKAKLTGRLERLAPSPMAAVACGAIVLFMVSFLWYAFGLGRFGEILEEHGVVLTLIHLLVDNDVGLIIAFTAGMVHWSRLNRQQKAVFLLYVFAYGSNRMITGSKQGLFYLTIFYCTFVVLVRQSQKINMLKLAISMAILSVLFPVTFAIGWATRTVTFSQEYKTQAIGLGDVFAATQNVKEARLTPAELVRSIFFRVNGFDDLVVVVSGLDHDLESYVTWRSVGESIVNFCIPGHLFPDALPSSRLFAPMYTGDTLATAFDIYHTEIWYLFGMWLPLLGVPLGIFAVFLTLFFLTILYKVICLSELANFAPYLKMLFGYAFYWIFVSMGPDEWISMMFIATVHLFFYLAFIKLSGFSLKPGSLRMASIGAVAGT